MVSKILTLCGKQLREAAFKAQKFIVPMHRRGRKMRIFRRNPAVMSRTTVGYSHRTVCGKMGGLTVK